MEAVILAGGLGTRLKGYTNGLPKPMVKVAGRAFLEIILDKLVDAGFTRVCLAVSYKAHFIKNHFGNTYKNLEIVYSEEDKPLGTGGAIKQAVANLSSEHIFILNGDTLVDVEFTKLLEFHVKNKADLTITTYEMTHYNRYGTVILDSNNKVTNFIEKKPTEKGLINAGTYIITKTFFKHFSLPEIFSFESDLMEKEIKNINEYGFITSGYFIDIGVPEDLERADKDLALP